MRVCFVGDSFVAGAGDPDCLGWAGRLCAGLVAHDPDFTLYNLGIRRDTSLDVAARWRQECHARLPQDAGGRVVFSFGVNDCVHEDGRPRVESAHSIAALREILSCCPWPALMVGPPPIADAEVNQRVHALSLQQRQVCDALGTPWFDTFQALADCTVWHAEVAAGDGAHPAALGYAALARAVGAWDSWKTWINP
jgi:lysophospholipase L1-like esterase